MSSSQFATVLGVHPTTVSRWENSPKPVVVEGMAHNVLTGLIRRMEAAEAAKRARVAGKKVSDALLVAGVLVALALLVRFAAGDDDR